MGNLDDAVKEVGKLMEDLPPKAKAAVIVFAILAVAGVCLIKEIGDGGSA